ncbi:Serine palmitoyltransferase 2 [Aduncisulcus paluster]|uniref:serine C-palmitoyltransferase n=1 Tax=Aduncisulcus paluster TaxID=2918883 RepID=A0ABQ5KVC9_9EUKA|nr:Serine palmitoyltransferase 2 [Aduncisulcus paluster]
MGFATNSTSIDILSGPDSLVISDRDNHASIAVGRKFSGASIDTFVHNSAEDLERVIRRNIARGNINKARRLSSKGEPVPYVPWKKILIVVEGTYSMSGEFPPLADIVRIKKKYGCYLYVDEAHSIGALGHTGRGICDKLGIDFSDVDILMGTFTKSFGSIGGYIAGDSKTIDNLRKYSLSSIISEPLCSTAAQQVLSALQVLRYTKEGEARIMSLHENAIYFRKHLSDMGFVTLGEDDSPVIPLMLYNPAKIAPMSRLLLERNIAAVVVGFPATPLLEARVRFCISAAHTKQDLDYILTHLDDIGDIVGCKYRKKEKLQEGKREKKSEDGSSDPPLSAESELTDCDDDPIIRDLSEEDKLDVVLKEKRSGGVQSECENEDGIDCDMVKKDREIEGFVLNVGK